MLQPIIEHYYSVATIALLALLAGSAATRTLAAWLDNVTKLAIHFWLASTSVFIVSATINFHWIWASAAAGSDLAIGLLFFLGGLPLGVLSYYFATALISGIVQSIQSRPPSLKDD